MPECGETTRAIVELKIMCRNALVGSRTQQGALVWRMDSAGCPEVAKLGGGSVVQADPSSDPRLERRLVSNS